MRPKYEFCVVVCLAVYFVYMSGAGGLGAGFTHDDLMNMDRAWSAGPSRLAWETALFFLPSDNYRPLGGLFYALCFDAFGLQPGPFRAVMLLILLANLALSYLTVRYLTGSQELSTLATLFHCYHPALAVFYSSTGQCYDVLCVFFYLAALTYYFRIRRRGRLPALHESLALLALLALALDSKEMAVTLPVTIGFYEIIFHRPRSWGQLPGWLAREARTAALGALAVAAFLYGRVYSGRDPLPAMEAYAPAPSFALWASNWSFWLDRLALRFNETPSLEWLPVTVLVIVSFAVAGRWRRHLLFALLFSVFAALPVSFITRRDLTAIDIPLTGVALAAAILVSGFAALVLHHWEDRPAVSSARPYVLCALCMSLLYDRYAGFSEYQRGHRDPESAQIHAVLDQYRLELPRLKAGCRILILVDPFQDQFHKHWASLFLLRLVNREPDLTVHRLVRMRAIPDEDSLERYDHVVTFDRDRLVRVTPQSRAAELRLASSRWRSAKPEGWNEGWDD